MSGKWIEGDWSCLDWFGNDGKMHHYTQMVLFFYDLPKLEIKPIYKYMALLMSSDEVGKGSGKIFALKLNKLFNIPNEKGRGWRFDNNKKCDTRDFPGTIQKSSVCDQPLIILEMLVCNNL